MTLPVTVDEGVAHIPETYMGEINIPKESPRIPVTEDVLAKPFMGLTDRVKWFNKGVFVAIKYEIYDELQFNSAYVITSTYETSDGRWKLGLAPTHGGASSLNGEQAYQYDNKLILERNLEKVRGGAKMQLAPIESDYILEELGGETQVVAHTI